MLEASASGAVRFGSSPAVIANAELKVLRPVVKFVAVLVVNRLVRKERSTNDLLHDEAMLENVLLANPEPTVSVTCDVPRTSFTVFEVQRISVSA